jgi:hypothetical protein
MSDLLLNQWAGRPSAGPVCGASRALGRVYFAFKPECDVISQTESVQNHLCARHRVEGVVPS